VAAGRRFLFVEQDCSIEAPVSSRRRGLLEPKRMREVTMESNTSGASIRESLARLARLLEEPEVDRDLRWYGALGDQLAELEQALGEGEAEPNRSDSLKEIRRTHPRLISICGEFQRSGRKLLRQAALVVRLSARSYDTGKEPHTELHSATESLMDAVKRHLELETELTVEAGQDLGGEG
jgi:hypothetical protein